MFEILGLFVDSLLKFVNMGFFDLVSLVLEIFFEKIIKSSKVFVLGVLVLGLC